MKEDSLRELTKQDQIEELLKVLYTDFPHSLHYWKFIKIISTWKALNPTISFQILVPCTQDLSDGTSIAVFSMSPVSEKTYMVYTLEPSGTKLKQALLHTNRIDWTDTHREWEAIHEKHMPVMREVFEAKFCVGRYLHHYHYYMPLEEARDLKVGEPSAGQLVKLSKDDAPLVDKYWEFTTPESIQYTRACIELNFGFGVSIGELESSELISWVTQTHYGGAGQLYTVDIHRKKGLAEILMRQFTKHVANSNEVPSVVVGGSNMASIRLNEKIGYKRVCQIYWYL